MNSQHEIHPFEYQGGKDVTQRLEKVLNTKGNMGLASTLGISKATVSTWHQRDQTPFEIVVRVHLATGVSLKWMLLGEGEMYEQATADSVTKSKIMLHELKNGQLNEVREMVIDDQTLADFGLEKVNVLAVRKGSDIQLIDTTQKLIISGTYLVTFDGLVALNELHRMPGSKTYMNFNGKDMEVEEGQIEVLGKASFLMINN